MALHLDNGEDANVGGDAVGMILPTPSRIQLSEVGTLPVVERFKAVEKLDTPVRNHAIHRTVLQARSSKARDRSGDTCVVEDEPEGALAVDLSCPYGSSHTHTDVGDGAEGAPSCA